MNKLGFLNKFLTGLIAGLLVPVITLVIVYFYTFHYYSVHEFVYFLKTMQVVSKLLSLCVIPNLLAFFIFIWLDYLNSARGVLAATFISAALVFIIPHII